MPSFNPQSRVAFAGPDSLVLEYTAPGFGRPHQALYLALDTRPIGGSVFAPFGRNDTGSTITLPFRADRLYIAHVLEDGGTGQACQEWKGTRWSGPMDVPPEFTVQITPDGVRINVHLDTLKHLAPVQPLRVAVWAKNLSANDGWGELLTDEALQIRGGFGDRVIDRYYDVDPVAQTIRIRTRSDRSPAGAAAPSPRPRIYQLLPRLFSNTNETRKPHGTIEENGVGKFAEIDERALASIRDLGCTHVWLTGVLRQATSTDYSSIGLPADEPALLKGRAGSPYAIVDYFDVSPDYAKVPANRLPEFRALLDRVHAAGLRAIIDFVPNHVARSYASTIKPKLSFGAFDDRTKFFDPANNFFWLQPDSPGGGPPLRLPTDDGPVVYSPEREHGRVTGNNSSTWQPGRNDWYETVKLNYGYDFTTGNRAYPHSERPDAPVPDTWLKMDAVIAYWQEFGVDGFRCDMAHMVPPEFWSWALDRARERQPGVFFAAEAYDNDPMKVGLGNVMLDLLGAGFDAVYDDPTYKVLKGVYEDGKWANDVDAALGAADREYLFTHSLRYAENHDEVRIAGRGQWGEWGDSAPLVGRAVSALLYGAGRGPVLLYSGQEVGEPARGAEGFGGDDAHTTIFDYWSMPELVKWVNGLSFDGGRLSPEQQDLRTFYQRLLRVVGQPAFRDGEFFGLNYAQGSRPSFGRLPGESASGHWLYAFLRSDRTTSQRFLCVVNLNPRETLRRVQIFLPSEALSFIGLTPSTALSLYDRLAVNPDFGLAVPRLNDGIEIPVIPPLTACFFELKTSPQ